MYKSIAVVFGALVIVGVNHFRQQKKEKTTEVKCLAKPNYSQGSCSMTSPNFLFTPKRIETKERACCNHNFDHNPDEISDGVVWYWVVSTPEKDNEPDLRPFGNKDDAERFMKLNVGSTMHYGETRVIRRIANGFVEQIAFPPKFSPVDSLNPGPLLLDKN